MKCLMILLTFLIPMATKTPVDENRDEFIDSVDAKYAYYTEVINESNQYYDLLVVQGIYNGKPSYGICFTSVDPGKYRLIIHYEGSFYSLNSNKRKDTNAIAIKADSTIVLHVLDQNDNELYLKANTLGIFLANTFSVDDATMGGDHGGDFSTLTNTKISLPFFKVLGFVSVIVIGSCMIVLMIFYFLRKGMFNNDKRKAGVLNIRAILQETTNDNQLSEDVFWEGYHQEQTKLPEPDDDNAPIMNIKEHLKELGFITTYSILNEDEKNLVMLELMRLKDSGEITAKDYYQETAELWKK